MWFRKPFYQNQVPEWKAAYIHLDDLIALAQRSHQVQQEYDALLSRAKKSEKDTIVSERRAGLRRRLQQKSGATSNNNDGDDKNTKECLKIHTHEGDCGIECEIGQEMSNVSEIGALLTSSYQAGSTSRPIGIYNQKYEDLHNTSHTYDKYGILPQNKDYHLMHLSKHEEQDELNEDEDGEKRSNTSANLSPILSHLSPASYTPTTTNTSIDTRENTGKNTKKVIPSLDSIPFQRHSYNQILLPSHSQIYSQEARNSIQSAKSHYSGKSIQSDDSTISSPLWFENNINRDKDTTSDLSKTPAQQKLGHIQPQGSQDYEIYFSGHNPNPQFGTTYLSHMKNHPQQRQPHPHPHPHQSLQRIQSIDTNTLSDSQPNNNLSFDLSATPRPLLFSSNSLFSPTLAVSRYDSFQPYTSGGEGDVGDMGDMDTREKIYQAGANRQISYDDRFFRNHEIMHGMSQGDRSDGGNGSGSGDDTYRDTDLLLDDMNSIQSYQSHQTYISAKSIPYGTIQQLHPQLKYQPIDPNANASTSTNRSNSKRRSSSSSSSSSISSSSARRFLQRQRTYQLSVRDESSLNPIEQAKKNVDTAEKLIYNRIRTDLTTVEQFYKRTKDLLQKEVDALFEKCEGVRNKGSKNNSESSPNSNSTSNSTSNSKSTKDISYEGLTISFRELLRALEMLRAYCQLNYSAFATFLSFYDSGCSKNQPERLLEGVLLPLVEQSRFHRSSWVQWAESQTIRKYSLIFDITPEESLKVLRYSPTERAIASTSSFQTGVVTGINICLLLAIILLIWIVPTSLSYPFFSTSAPLIRLLCVCIVFLYGWGAVLWACEKTNINYIFVLDLDPSTALTSAKTWFIASTFTFVCLASSLVCSILYLRSWVIGMEMLHAASVQGSMDGSEVLTGGGIDPIHVAETVSSMNTAAAAVTAAKIANSTNLITNTTASDFLSADKLHSLFSTPTIVHCIIFALFFIIIFNPLPYVVYPTRKYLGINVLAVLLAPFYQVNFERTFIGDQLCSLTKVFFDLTYAICFYFGSSLGDFIMVWLGYGHGGIPYEQCRPFVKRLQWCIAFLPPLIRIVQCYKMYYKRNFDIRQIFNAGKYTVSILMTLCAMSYKSSNNDLLQYKSIYGADVVESIISSAQSMDSSMLFSLATAGSMANSVALNLVDGVSVVGNTAKSATYWIARGGTGDVNSDDEKAGRGGRNGTKGRKKTTALKHLHDIGTKRVKNIKVDKEKDKEKEKEEETVDIDSTANATLEKDTELVDDILHDSKYESIAIIHDIIEKRNKKMAAQSKGDNNITNNTTNTPTHPISSTNRPLYSPYITFEEMKKYLKENYILPSSNILYSYAVGGKQEVDEGGRYRQKDIPVVPMLLDTSSDLISVATTPYEIIECILYDDLIQAFIDSETTVHEDVGKSTNVDTPTDTSLTTDDTLSQIQINHLVDVEEVYNEDSGQNTPIFDSQPQQSRQPQLDPLDRFFHRHIFETSEKLAIQILQNYDAESNQGDSNEKSRNVDQSLSLDIYYDMRGIRSEEILRSAGIIPTSGISTSGMSTSSMNTARHDMNPLASLLLPHAAYHATSGNNDNSMTTTITSTPIYVERVESVDFGMNNNNNNNNSTNNLYVSSSTSTTSTPPKVHIDLNTLTRKSMQEINQTIDEILLAYRWTKVFLYMFLCSAVCATCYSFFWDIRFDWGLLEQGADFPLRRKSVFNTNRVFKKHFYSIAIIINFILRCTWVDTLLPTSMGLSILRDDFFVFLITVLEVLRRTLWNFIRLENEHLNNVGEFRSYNIVIPDLPPIIQTSRDEREASKARKATKAKEAKEAKEARDAKEAREAKEVKDFHRRNKKQDNIDDVKSPTYGIQTNASYGSFDRLQSSTTGATTTTTPTTMTNNSTITPISPIITSMSNFNDSRNGRHGTMSKTQKHEENYGQEEGEKQDYEKDMNEYTSLLPSTATSMTASSATAISTTTANLTDFEIAITDDSAAHDHRITDREDTLLIDDHLSTCSIRSVHDDHNVQDTHHDQNTQHPQNHDEHPYYHHDDYGNSSSMALTQSVESISSLGSHGVNDSSGSLRSIKSTGSTGSSRSIRPTRSLHTTPLLSTLKSPETSMVNIPHIVDSSSSSNQDRDDDRNSKNLNNIQDILSPIHSETPSDEYDQINDIYHDDEHHHHHRDNDYRELCESCESTGTSRGDMLLLASGKKILQSSSTSISTPVSTSKSTHNLNQNEHNLETQSLNVKITDDSHQSYHHSQNHSQNHSQSHKQSNGKEQFDQLFPQSYAQSTILSTSCQAHKPYFTQKNENSIGESNSEKYYPKSQNQRLDTADIQSNIFEYTQQNHTHARDEIASNPRVNIDMDDDDYINHNQPSIRGLGNLSVNRSPSDSSSNEVSPCSCGPTRLLLVAKQKNIVRSVHVALAVQKARRKFMGLLRKSRK